MMFTLKMINYMQKKCLIEETMQFIKVCWPIITSVKKKMLPNNC